MRANLVTVALTAVLGTTNVSVIGALDSGVLGVDATKAPFTPETRDLIEFGGVASVLFEDVPQVPFWCCVAGAVVAACEVTLPLSKSLTWLYRNCAAGGGDRVPCHQSSGGRIQFNRGLPHHSGERRQRADRSFPTSHPVLRRRRRS